MSSDSLLRIPGRRSGGRGRCWCGCEASIISLLARVPFLVSFSFLAAEEPGYFRSPQLLSPGAAAGCGEGGGGRGRTGLRALLQAFVNGPRLSGRPDGRRPPGRADSPGLARRPFWHCNSEAGGSFLLAREQYQGQPGDLPPTPSSFHCEPLLDPRPLGSPAGGGGRGSVWAQRAEQCVAPPVVCLHFPGWPGF